MRRKTDFGDEEGILDDEECFLVTVTSGMCLPFCLLLLGTARPLQVRPLNEENP